jgi:hypothetical protein
MVNSKKAGVIGCDMSEEFFQSFDRNQVEKIIWKKIWVSDTSNTVIDNAYTEAEIVADAESIFNDEDISLVIVSSKHMTYVPQVLQAGKSVRVI